MMSKSTTGASQPSRRVLPSFRTRDRWSLAASPCSYSLLLLATVVVVQLYNFSTVASSKRVQVSQSFHFQTKQERERKREKKSDDNPIYRNALQNKSIKEKKRKKSWVCSFRPSTGCSVCFFLNKKRNEAEKERQTDSIIGEQRFVFFFWPLLEQQESVTTTAALREC